MFCTVERIIGLLKQQCKTQKDLADYLGIKNQVITDWKTGKTKTFYDFIPEIADFFDVPADKLFGRSFEIKKNNAPDDSYRSELKKIVSGLSESELDELILFIQFMEYKRGQSSSSDDGV